MATKTKTTKTSAKEKTTTKKRRGVYNANALDPDVMEKEIAKEESGNRKTWKPPSKEEGDWIVRVLPPEEGETLWYKHSKVHFLKGVGKFYCLRNWGKPCPICEHGTKLYDYDDPKGEDSTLAKELFANDEYLTRAYVKEDNKEKAVNELVIWDCGIGMWKKLKSYIDKKVVKKIGMIFDPFKGRDFIIKKSGTGRNSNYDNSEKDDVSTQLIDGEDDDVLDLLEEAFEKLDYNEVIVEPTKKELKEALNSFLSSRTNQDTDLDDDDDEEDLENNNEESDDVVEDFDEEDVDDVINDLEGEEEGEEEVEPV